MDGTRFLGVRQGRHVGSAVGRRVDNGGGRMQTGLQTAESAGQCWSTSERGLFESKNREARRSEPNPVDRETDIIFPCSQKEVLQNAQLSSTISPTISSNYANAFRN